MNGHAENNNILSEEQYGLRKKRRTINCFYILNTLIEKTSAEKSPLFVCYVDFKKAFDSVQHNCLHF